MQIVATYDTTKKLFKTKQIFQKKKEKKKKETFLNKNGRSTKKNHNFYRNFLCDKL